LGFTDLWIIIILADFGQNIFKQQNKTNQNAERHSKFTTHQNKTVAIFVVDAV